MTGRLTNKRALITGAASGIGLAVARLFLAEGARVAAADRNAEGLGDLPREGASVFAFEVTDELRWRDAVDAVVGEFGGLDILVNSAGIAIGGNIETATLRSSRASEREPSGATPVPPMPPVTWALWRGSTHKRVSKSRACEVRDRRGFCSLSRGRTCHTAVKSSVTSAPRPHENWSRREIVRTKLLQNTIRNNTLKLCLSLRSHVVGTGRIGADFGRIGP